MRGEGTQALLNALLIPDVRIDLMENGKLRTVQGGNMKAGLPHQAEKPRCFQGYRLTTGIGAGDDEQVIIPSQADIDGHRGFFIQEGMSCPPDINNVFVVKYRLRGILLQGKGCLGKNKIQARKDFLVFRNILCVVGNLGAESGQNLFYFFLFFDFQLAHLVVQVNHRGRLNEKRASGGGLIVDHAWHLAPVFGLDRDTVASVSGSNQGILQVGMQGAVYHAGQLGMDAVRGNRHAAAHMLQAGAGVVADFLFGKDAAVDFVGNGGQRLNPLKKRSKGILLHVLPFLPPVGLNPSCILQKPCDTQKLRRGKRSSDFQGFQAHAQFPVVTEGDAAFFEKTGEGVSCFPLGGTDVVQLRHRCQLAAKPASRVRGRMLGEAGDNFVIFKRL